MVIRSNAVLCEAQPSLIRSSYGYMRLNERLIRVLYERSSLDLRAVFFHENTDTMPPLRRKKKAAAAGVVESPPTRGKDKRKDAVDEPPTQGSSAENQEKGKEPYDDVPKPTQENDNSCSCVPDVPDVQVPTSSSSSAVPVVAASSPVSEPPEPPRSPSPPPPDPDTDILQPAEDEMSGNTCAKYLFTEAQKMELADFYREHKLFYNKKINAYKNAAKKKRLMEEMAASLTPPFTITANKRTTTTCKYFLYLFNSLPFM